MSAPTKWGLCLTAVCAWTLTNRSVEAQFPGQPQFSGPPVFAQPVSSQAPGSWADQIVDTRNVDFGVIATGSEAKKQIRIANTTKHQVHVASVSTTCGCSAATLGERLLQPGQETTVEITMNTRKFRRRKDSNVIIQFDAPAFAEVRIPITAYIRTDVVFNPGSINFGEVDYGTEVIRSVQIAYAGRGDWEIVDVKYPGELLGVELIPKGRTATGSSFRIDYELNVQLKPGLRAGRVRDVVTLVTNDQNNPYVPLMVEGSVVSDINVTPETVDIGSLRPGQSKEFKVIVRGKKPFRVTEIVCDDMGECFEVTLNESEKPIHVLPIRFNAPNRPGTFSREVNISIAGRNEPVRFIANGRILDATIGSGSE